MVAFRVFISAVLGALMARAAPAHQPRQSIATLSATQISAFTPYTSFAAAGYCTPNSTLTWSCGANCKANPDFIPTASGEMAILSSSVWYVGYEPSLHSVIVAHQGTDPSQISALLTDSSFFLENLNSALFPGVSSSIKAHSGFANEHAKTATLILAAVQNTMSAHKTTTVGLTGHSLGAALSVLDSIYLPLHLPSGTTFKTVVYGLPRVGNQAFANYVDAHVSLNHINNQEDLVPILPGEILGFVHPAGEVHITDGGIWMACPGQDNPSSSCIVGDVPTIFNGQIGDHDGPYNGIMMDC